MQRTALYDMHLKYGARMVEYSGWEMPLNYGSQIEEHLAVRKSAGIFDVSHMMITDIQGNEAQSFLRNILANDVMKLQTPGQALYSCMLNKNGGVIDDLIVYFRQEDLYRIISNAGTREKVSEWLAQSAQGYKVELIPGNNLSIIALQGPDSREIVSKVFTQQTDQIVNLPKFHSFSWGAHFIACTGYTGEDGFEIIIPAEQSTQLWDQLIAAGAKPAGLGARDSLRLEAGMNLYGSDMDETTTPLETGLAWTIAWKPDDRKFTGRKALEMQKKSGIANKQIGLVLQGKGVFRAHQPVFSDNQLVGEITSGGFSPVLGTSIALARVQVNVGSDLEVQIRNKKHPADIVLPPFI